MVLIGVIVGEIAYWLHGSRRSITHQNLSACFPDADAKWIRRTARRHFHHMVTSIFTIAITWWAPRGRILRLYSVDDQTTMDRIMGGDEPIILLAPHFTSLEYTGMIFFCQRDMSTMYQRHKNPDVDQLITGRRTRYGGTLFDYKDISPTLIKSLRSGIPFYYLPDQDPGRKNGVFAKFYGIPTATYPALGKIARLGRAKVIPCMARLKPWGTGFELIFGEEIPDYPTGDDVVDATTMNHHIEKLIAHAPEQYFWSHKRFKTRPEGDPPFYS